MNKNFLKYLFRKYRSIIFIFLIILISLVITTLSQASRNGLFDYYTDQRMTYYQTIPFIYAVIFTYALPITLFQFVNQRKSADLYFSLPISRAELLWTNLLFAWLICVSYFILGSLPALMALPGFGMTFSVNLLKGILCLTSLLLINTLWFLLGNNLFDNIVVLLGYSILPGVMFLCYSAFTSGQLPSFSMIQSTFSDCIQLLSPVYLSVLFFENTAAFPDWINILVLIIYALVGIRFLYPEFINRKTERAEQLSTRFFAYPFLLNFYTFLITLAIFFQYAPKNMGYSTAVLLIALFTGYIVARFITLRQLKLTWQDLLKFCVYIAVSYAIATMSWNTRAFHLADRIYQPDEYQNMEFNYTSYASPEVNGNALDVSFTITDADKDSEAAVIVEQYIDASINYFYDRGTKDVWYNSNLSMTAMDEKQKYISYYFNSEEMLTVTDLKKINKSVPVTVYDYDNSENISLDDYLRKLGLAK